MRGGKIRCVRLAVHFPNELVVLRHSWSHVHVSCSVLAVPLQLTRQFADVFFYLFFSRRSPTWERCFHFVCWWEFRKVLAFLPLGCWTHRVNWVKYLRRVDLCLFTSRHGMTSHKIWNIQQLQCENSKFHILFGIIKTRVRFDMHGNYYYLLFCICSLGDCL